MAWSAESEVSKLFVLPGRAEWLKLKTLASSHLATIGPDVDVALVRLLSEPTSTARTRP